MKTRLLSILFIAFFSASLLANETKISSNPYLQNYESNYFASQTEVANQLSRQIAALEAMEAAASSSMTNRKDNTNIDYAGINNAGNTMSAANTQNTTSTNAPQTSNTQQPNQTTTTNNANPWSKPNPWASSSTPVQNNQNIALPPPPNIFTGPTARSPVANNPGAGTGIPATKPDLTK